MSSLIICAALILLILTISFIIIFDIRTMVYLTLISIFFPVHIRFMGKDAITTGTVLIILLFIKYFLVSVFEKRFIREKYDYLIYILILLGFFSLLIPYSSGLLSKIQMGPAVRLYFTFFSSLLFFLVIKNLPHIKYQSKIESEQVWIEKLFNAFLILIAIHITISICVKFYPSFGSLFKPFLSREGVVFEAVNRGTIGRIRSFVFTPESYGEMLATLSPILIYKIYRYKNPFWLCCLFLFAMGLLFTVTRSGILLFITGIFISVLYMSRKKLSKTLLMVYVTLSGLLVFVIVNPPVLGDIMLRFEGARETYNEGGSIFQTMNRDFLPDVWDMVIAKISLLGNGATDYNFHNLFLTTLHRRGIAGAVFFFLVLLYPMAFLVKSFLKHDDNKDKSIVFLCLLSMTLFCINELKYEFTRGGSYQQLCWVLFAIYYMVGNNHLQPASVNLQEKQE